MQPLKLLFLTLFFAAAAASGQTNASVITREMALSAEKLIGLEFSDAKLDMLLPGLRSQLEDYEVLHHFALSNAIPPAMMFNPLPVGFKMPTERRKVRVKPAGKVSLPANRDDLAFYSVGQLAVLLKSKQLSSEALTRFYLERLKKYGPRLECVVTLTEDLALQQARRADAEIEAGHYRGPLHGIPYGAKDLLATKGIRTTWGAPPYTNQVFNFDATVIKRLENAGAVLIAKTTLGELAMNDTWFGGKTRNPWNIKEGSSGSSAGSCAGTAAGLFPFAIGTETYGSIVSPSDRCGTTGLRPTYGRVSRSGAMALSWSMDKIGTICRTVEDCAVVFNAIYGPDGIDQTLYDAPFNYDSRLDIRKLRVGYLQKDFDAEKDERRSNDLAAIKQIRALGIELVPVEIPHFPLEQISFVLSTEGAAAFEDLTRTGHDDWLKQQGRGSWPNTFRRKRFVPAVEYLQAQRIRFLLIQEMAKLFEKVDVIVAPSFSGDALLAGNLSGHPCVVLPDGFTSKMTPTSLCFLGRLFGEAEMLAVAKKYQDATDWHRRHPSLRAFDSESSSQATNSGS